MMHIQDDFSSDPRPRWTVTETGQGFLRHAPGALTLTVHPTPESAYSNAQISDYGSARTARKAGFRWHPPVTMRVRAWAAQPIHGTAGFGFWNHPFAPGEPGFRLPKALWFFFGSPENDMRLARGVPGSGWKAATFDATGWPFLALLPLALPGLVLMRIPPLYDRLWPIGQRALGVSERLLDSALLNTPRTYQIDWQPEHVTFTIDDEIVHYAPVAIRGPLGFIAWIDNQYAVVTPQGRFRLGFVPVRQTQALVLEDVTVHYRS